MITIFPGISLEYRVADTGGVRAVLVDYREHKSDGEGNQDLSNIKIIAISKYPLGPRYNGNMDDFKDEMKWFCSAKDYPFLTMSKYTRSDCFLINGWDGELWSDEYTKQICNEWLSDNGKI